MRAAIATAATGTTITVAALGPRSRELGRMLAEDDTFEVALTADTFPELLSHDAFPTRVLIIDETADRDCTRARIEIAQTLGTRVVLVVTRPLSPRTPWAADLVVQSDIDRAELLRLAELDSEARRRRRQDAAASPPRKGFTAREREAYDIWSRRRSVIAVATEMGVSNATASTFLWRARRKLRAGLSP